jgi:CheY-like chemotaxis protein
MRLPLSVVAVGEDIPLREPRAAGAALGGRPALVVDDNRDAATAIGELMRAIGFTTHLAHDALTALEAAREFHPDVALLDIGLPKIDGYELARRLRGLYPSLRIVAVTGFGQPSDRVRSRNAGFDEHIVKPVNIEALRRVIEKVGAAAE